jgi:hypothetical protein
MKDDISQEAKNALANLAKQKAQIRLERDGACSIEAIRRRLRWIAHERKLPAAEIAKLMQGRVSTGARMAFCKKHNVSMEWLLCGSLQELARMTRQRKAAEADRDDAAYRDLLAAFGKLDRDSRKAIVSYLATQT